MTAQRKQRIRDTAVEPALDDSAIDTASAVLLTLADRFNFTSANHAEGQVAAARLLTANLYLANYLSQRRNGVDEEEALSIAAIILSESQRTT